MGFIKNTIVDWVVIVWKKKKVSQEKRAKIVVDGLSSERSQANIA